MIDFVELKETQKKYVLHLMDRFNLDTEVITLDDMKSFHEIMIMERHTGGPKFGYPNWLIKPNNKVSMSVYHFPKPTREDLEAFNNGDVDSHIQLKKYSQMFQDVVKEYNLL